MLEHKKIKGAHNVIFLDDRTVAICGTRIGSVLIFDLEDNKLKKEYVLNEYAPVKKHLFWPMVIYKMKIFLKEKKIKKSAIAAKPCFVRGLVKYKDLLFVGTSPAMILCFDLKTDELVDHYIYSKKTRAAIHGLNVREE